MKVDQNPELYVAARQAEATASKQSKQAVKTTGPAAEEASKSAQVVTSTVSFSSSAKALTATGRATSEFNDAKVKEVSEAIKNGTFKISAEAIADKLLADTGEVLAHSIAARAA